MRMTRGRKFAARPRVTRTEEDPLASLVAEYRRTFGRRHGVERDFYASLANLELAVRFAATARTPDGKCNAHQRRIGRVKLQVFEQQLQRVRSRIAACKTFEELVTLIGEQRTHKIGELAVYDTAVRIGHFRDIAPTSVYLHAGTRVGAAALGFKGPVIHMHELPPSLAALSAAEAEDFLCIYKSDLAALRDLTKPDRGSRRSRRPGGCGPST